MAPNENRKAQRIRKQAQRKLKELEKANNDTEQHQQDIQNIQKLLNQKDDEILKLSEADIAAMDFEMDLDENVDDAAPQSLFVSEQDHDLARPSVEFAADVKQVGEDEDEHGPPLYAPPKAEDIPGSDTVAYQLGRLVKTYINRYGPKNAGCYRIEPIALNPQYEAQLSADDAMRITHNTCSPANSAGSQRNPDGTRTYDSRHLLYIVAVAWGVKGTGMPREEDLELLRPEKNKKWREIPTKVLVAWQVDKNKVVKCWETRSTIRDRWRKANADEAIYQAACKGWERYMQVVHGTRQPLDRSPSAGFVAPPSGRRERSYHEDSHREGPLGASSRRDWTPAWSARGGTPGYDRARPRSSRNGSPWQHRRSRSRSSDEPDVDAYVDDFLTEHGFESLDELDRDGMYDFLSSWRPRAMIVA
jgi:hypothetical protein